MMQVIILLLGLGSLLSLSGCSKQIDREEAIFQQSQRMFEAYLVGDETTARRNLESEIKLLENPTVTLYLPRQATVLFMECSRLYVLEKRVGNIQKADVALTKARYWNLRRFESDGDLTATKLEDLESFTQDKILQLVDDSDKVHTKGKGPKYVRRDR